MILCKKLFLIGMVLLLLAFNLSAQWEPDVRLTYNPAQSYTSVNNSWSIAATGDTIHVVWYDQRDSLSEIYYKRSTDGGTTWGLDTRLTYDTTFSLNPCITVADCNVYVAWWDGRDGNYEIYFKRSTDGGTVWEVDTKLTDAPESSFSPCIAVSSSRNTVHVVWIDDRDWDTGEVYYKRSPDGGATWGEDIRLTDDPGWTSKPSIAVSDSTLHVVWTDERYVDPKIFYKRSLDGGTTWSVDTMLSDDLIGSSGPSIAVSNSNVHVVWYDYREIPMEIYYKRSTDAGATWGLDTRLTYDTTFSLNPSIAVSGNNVHTVWWDWEDNEIFYKRSTDGGTTWDVDIRLTGDPAWSWRQSIAVSGSKVHVVWTDDRDGNDEIYYKRNSTGNPGINENKNHRHTTTDMRLTCHPNPFTTSTTISLSLPSIEHSAEGIELKVYDISGRLIKSFPLTTNHLSLGTDLQPGIYFLKLNGKPVGKVVKVR